MCKNKKEVINAIQNNIIHYPFIQKSRKDGYDGKGVILIKDDHSLDSLFDVPSMVEEFIEIEKKLLLFPEMKMVKQILSRQKWNLVLKQTSLSINLPI